MDPCSHCSCSTASPASTPQSTVEEPGISDPFDFYIDSVQNIPDNASVTKVSTHTCRKYEPMELKYFILCLLFYIF